VVLLVGVAPGRWLELEHVAGMVGEPGYAKRRVGRSLYQKLPQVVSSSIHGGASGGWAGRYIKCCPKLWPALDVRGVSVLYLLREGAEIFVCCLEMCVCTHIGECVVIRVESAVDGISKAVVLLQF
jgi:hypothetical protein